MIAFGAIALFFGAAYALITPAFEVPDEVAHYWRATAAAYGHVVVGERVALPRGYRMIVWALALTPDDARVTPERLRRGRGVMLQDDYRDPTPVAGLYSPATYAPQIVAAAVARAAQARPFFSFFAGRLATLLFAVAGVVVVCRIAPAFRDLFETVALLPMTLFLFGSWSADALTIVAAFVTSALLLRAIVGVIPSEARNPLPSRTGFLAVSAARNDTLTRGEIAAIVAAVAWLSLCKPPYVLLALLAFAIPRRRFVERSAWRRHSTFLTLVVAVMIAGTAASSAMTMSGMEMPSPRTRPIDTRTQIRFVASDPLHFAGVIASDLREHGGDYVESMTGRLGRYQLKLPRSVTALLLLMLVAVGVTAGPPLPPRARLLIVAITAAVALATLTYLYLTSSIAGGDVIEGTQGRYLLPLLPLLMATLRIRAVRFSVPAIAVYLVAIVANGAGIVMLLRHYYW
jgi:uncharacterized membrane protein